MTINAKGKRGFRMYNKKIRFTKSGKAIKPYMSRHFSNRLAVKSLDDFIKEIYNKTRASFITTDSNFNHLSEAVNYLIIVHEKSLFSNNEQNAKVKGDAV